MNWNDKSLKARAEETLALQHDHTADAIGFWRARACFFAEQLLRGTEPTAASNELPKESHKMITVKELREILEKMPDNVPVKINSTGKWTGTKEAYEVKFEGSHVLIESR